MTDSRLSAAELLLPFVVAASVALLIIPVPPAAIDVLIPLNLGLGCLLLFVALSVPSAVSLSALPGILLLSTLFRLGLNVSTTRLILGEADAGQVVDAFAASVVSGSYLVGAVVFTIITVVQYLVISNGAGRIAEVAARFSLDALPGAQLAIDSDLRAGTIDQIEATRRRQSLAEESRLFGALDGAMRFVRGDAIAGLLITGVNLAGGVTLGMRVEGLSLNQALHRYGLLTIGDGLTAQIPALFVSVAAGLIVTRVVRSDGQSSLPRDVVEQLFRHRSPLLATAALMALVGLVPGLPLLPFWLLSAALGFLAWQRQGQEPHKELSARPRLCLRVGPDLTQSLGGREALTRLGEAVVREAAGPLRLRVFELAVEICEADGPDFWQLLLDGVRLDGTTLDPSTPEPSAHQLQQALLVSMKGITPELIGVQEVRDLLDDLMGREPALVYEVVPARVRLPELVELVRGLARERLPAGDLRTVLEALLLDTPQGESGPEGRYRAARRAFKRLITQRAMAGRAGRVLPVTLLGDLFETSLKELARERRSRALEADPELFADLQASLRAAFPRAPSSSPSVLLTSPQVRSAVHSVAHSICPELLVLAAEDLAVGIEIEPVAELRPGAVSP